MAGNQIQFGVGFNVDSSGLQKAKHELESILNLTKQDFMNLRPELDSRNVNKEFEKLKEHAGQLNDIMNKSFSTELGTVNISKFNQELKKLDIQAIGRSFNSLGTQGQNAFRGIATEVLTTDRQLKKSHETLNNIATTMKNTTKWWVSSSIMNGFSQSVQEAYGYVKSLDSSLNDIRIVTNKSTEEMASFAEQANNAAKALGATTTDYTKGALTFYQQGLGDEEAAARTETTLKAANVTGESSAKVAENLTAVWNGFKVSVEETEQAVDKLAAVGANTASSMRELSEGMAKTASSASAMGVSEDQLAATLATVISTTRADAATVGTAFKTIYARISDIKAGTADAEVSLGNYTGKMAQMGINVLNSSGQMRDLGEVIEEVGSKWGDLTREQQISLAQTMAGQRQYNNLIALFDNFDEYNRALAISEESVGTLAQQQDIYMDSMEAHLNKLKSAKEDVFDSLFDASSFNDLLDGLTTVTTLFADFVDSIGGGGTLLLGLGSIGARVFSQQISGGIATFIQNMKIASSETGQLNARLEVFNKFNMADMDDVAYRTILDLVQQRMSVEESMTAEEYNRYNALVKQTNELLSQEKIAEDQLKIAEETIAQRRQASLLRTPSSNPIDLSAKATGFEQNADGTFNTSNLEKIKKETETTLANITAVEKAFNQTMRSAMKDLDDNITVTQGSTAKNINKIQNTLDEASRRLTDFQKNNKYLSNEEVWDTSKADSYLSQLEKVRRERETLAKTVITNPQDVDSINKLNDAIQNEVFLLNQLQEDIRDTSALRKEDNQAVFDAVKAAQGLELTKTNIDLNKQGMGNIVDTKRIQQQVQSIVNLVGAMGQLSMAISSLSNLPSIFNNDDISNGEKLLQIITNLGFTLPLLVNGLGSVEKGLGKTAKSFSELFGQRAKQSKQDATIAAETAAIEAQKAVQEQEIEVSMATAKVKKAEGDAREIAARKAVVAAEQEKLASEMSARAAEMERLAKKSEATRKDGNSTHAAERAYKQWSIKAEEQEAAARRQAALSAEMETIAKEEETAAEALNSAEKEKNAAETVLQTQQERAHAASTAAETAATNAGAAAKLKNAGAMALSLAKAHPLAVALGLVAGAYYLITKRSRDAKKANEELTKSFEKWGQAKTDLQSVEDELKNAKDRIDELNSRAGELTIVEEEELKKLKSQTAELESQVELKKQLAEKEGKDAAEKAKKAFDKNDGYDKYNQRRQQWEQVQNDYKAAGQEIPKEVKEEWEGLLKDAYLNEAEARSEALESFKVDADKYSEEIAKIEKDNVAYLKDTGKMINVVGAFTNNAFDTEGDRIESAQKLKDYRHDQQGTVDWNEDTLSAAGLSEDAIKMMQEVANSQQISVNDLANAWLSAADGISNYGEHISKLIETQAQLLETPEAQKAAAEEFDNFVQQQTKNGVSQQDIASAIGKVDLSEIDFSDPINGAKLLREELERIQEELAKTARHNANLKDMELLGFNKKDKADIEDRIKDVQRLAKENKNYAESLADDEVAAETVAIALKQTDKGLTKLTKNWKKYSAAVKAGGTTADSTVKEMRDYTEDFLNVSDEAAASGVHLSDSFMQQAVASGDLEDALNENEEALLRLQRSAIEDIILQINPDLQSIEDLGPELNSDLDQVFATIPDLEIGASIESTGLNESLNEIINACASTTTDAEQILAGLGFNAHVEEVSQESTGSTWVPPVYSLHHYPVSEETGGPYDELELVEAGHFETTPNPGSATALKITSGEYTGGGNVTKSGSSGGKSTGGGGKGKKGGGGKGKSKKPNKSKEKRLHEEKDIYREINETIADLNHELDELKTRQEYLAGDNLINNLEKQASVLEDINKATQKKIKLTEKDIKTRKKQLASGTGMLKDAGYTDAEIKKLKKAGVDFKKAAVQFEADGDIANYDAVVSSYKKAYNKIVKKYNASTDEETKKKYKEQMDAVKTALDDVKSAMDKYAELDDQRAELEKEMIENRLEIIEAIIEKHEIKVKATLEVVDLQKTLNELSNTVLDITVRPHFTDTVSAKSKNAANNFDTAMTKAKVDSDNLAYWQNELRRINEGDKTSEFYIPETGEFNVQAVIEKVNEYTENSASDIADLASAVNEMYDAWLEGIDNTIEAMEEEIELMEYINDILDTSKNLIGLMYGDEAYDRMSDYYNMQYSHSVNTISMLYKNVEYYKAQLNKAIADGDEEEIERWRQAYQDAMSQCNEALEEALQLILDKYENAIRKIFKDFEAQFSNGLDFNIVSDGWDLLKDTSDDVLDNVERIYEVNKLANRYAESINQSTDLKVQQRLTHLMQQQTKELQEKAELTQYDVDRANKLYELELKRIALEDAQNNKTKMRLRRDSQGNYTYQFVADQGEIDKAKQELADAQNDLYELNKNQYISTVDEMQSVWKEYQDKRIEIETKYAGDSAKLAEARAQLDEWYSKKLQTTMMNNQTAISNFMNDDYSAMTKFNTEVTKNLVANNEIISSSMQSFMDALMAEGTDNYIAKMNDQVRIASDEMKREQTEVAQSVGTTYEQLGSFVLNQIEPMQTLLSLAQQNTAEAKSEMDYSEQIYNNYKNASDAAGTLASNIAQATQNTISLVAAANNITIPVAASSVAQSMGTSNQEGNTPKSNPITGSTTLTVAADRDYLATTGNLSTALADAMSPNGLLAKSAESLLSAVNIESSTLDSILETLNGIGDTLSNTLNSFMVGAESKIISGTSNDSHDTSSIIQNIEINADFPNANSADDIVQAFSSLRNMATQYINNNSMIKN